MATLEDKILGDKLENYCSSSEDERDDDGGDDDGRHSDNGKGSAAAAPSATSGATFYSNVDKWSGSSANTGPKGVIKDWQRFKQLETEKNEEKEQERLRLMKNLCITAKTKEEDLKQQAKDETLEEELEAMFDLADYQKQRMQEMMKICSLQKTFGGKVHALLNGDDFLRAIDEEHKQSTIIVHIYENTLGACRTMNKSLDNLAQEYPNVKFCRILSSAAGLSQKFKQSGIPALLIYKAGNLIGNFVRVSEALGGDDFYASDVESYLIEHGMLPDKTHVPVIINSNSNNDSSDDDDD